MARCSRSTTLLLAAALMLGAGCTAHSYDPPKPDGGPIDGEWAPPDWTGGEVGANPGRWEHVGPVEVVRDRQPDFDRQLTAPTVTDDSADERGLGGPEAGTPLFGDAEEIVFAAVDVRQGRRYRVRVSTEDLELLHDAMIRDGGIHARGDDYRRGDERELEGEPAPENGYGTAYRPTGPPAEGPSTPRILPATWSDNTDTRSRRAIADGFSANHSTYRRIGQLNSSCSGTLIGPRHVLTAAHCLVDNSDQDVFWSVFRPRRNGENNAPWGARDPEWYWFPEEYWDGTCTGSGNCNRYDIALVILAPWEGAHPGWFGYWYVGGGTMETWNIYLRGYPRADPSDDTCWDYPSAPASCTPWVLYGDTELCDVGSFFSPDSDGWNREISVDCDGSRGMSGSSFYTYDAHPAGPVALGEYSQAWCTPPTGCQGMTFANVMTRITPQYASIISWWRNFCPTTQAQCF